jgi:hypothetical protein
MGGTECGSERAVCCTRARKVCSAQIARRVRQRDRINLSESGSCRNEALERHSEALHIGRCGGVPKARARCFEHTPRRECCQRRSKPRPSRICRLRRSAGGVNARRPCGTHGRSAAKSVDAAEHRMRIQSRWARDLRRNQEERCDARSRLTSPRRCSRTIAANRDELLAGLSRAFVARL